ncbi:ATPase-like protein [Metarhizium guizhouense ARSEF 977]|uniref:ATPase-like protein n=1 Tax=Metarhizium guizhouense (strain ARSEF 977) TaxID=1276136 RepID=A0A0B4G7W6_METGA|nr:ATPase-like protein [Metarhizium guizhouense ARSEF 977]
MTAFHFWQPILIDRILDYLQQQPPANRSPNVGYGLTGATVSVNVGVAISAAFYWYFQERSMYMARGALAGEIYKKTTEAMASASRNSAAIIEVSADVERILTGCLNIHKFWANAIQAGLASRLLSRQIGPSSVSPLIVVGCCHLF